MKKKYTFFHDPGHGWLAVPLEDIKVLGIKDQISICSYVKGDIAYLEEDCDMGIFLDAAKAAGWELEKFGDHYQEITPIRDYMSFEPSFVR